MNFNQIYLVKSINFIKNLPYFSNFNPATQKLMKETIIYFIIDNVENL